MHSCCVDKQSGCERRECYLAPNDLLRLGNEAGKLDGPGNPLGLSVLPYDYP